MSRFRALAIAALLAGCKGDAPAPPKPGSAGSSVSTGAGDPVRAEVTDDEGRAVLAVMAEYVAALCTCSDPACLSPVIDRYRGNPRISAQLGTTFTLSAADATTLLELKQRQVQCLSVASGISSELAKLATDAKAKVDDQKLLLDRSIPATTAPGKAYLPKLRDHTKAACACKTTDCYEALVEPADPGEDLSVDEMQYALKLTVLYAECGMALVSQSIDGLDP